MKTWYPKITNTGTPHEQGLIIDGETGDNIAVAYDSKNTALLAAAPELLEALEAIESLPVDDNGERVIPAGFLDKAREAIAKVR